MIYLKPKKTAPLQENSLVVLDFDGYYFLDVGVSEKLARKELESFLSYKLATKYSLALEPYEFFYEPSTQAEHYFVYAVKKKLFNKNRKKTITPKQLLCADLEAKYYLLMIGENESCLFLYHQGKYVLHNHISFTRANLQEHGKVQELVHFIEGIIEHLNDSTPLAKDTLSLYVYIENDNQEIETHISAFKEALSSFHIKALTFDTVLQNVTFNLHKGRKTLLTFRALSFYGGMLALNVLGFLVGSIYLNYSNASIEKEIASLQYFYNTTNKDAKDYYALQKELETVQVTHKEVSEQLKELVTHSRLYDLTDVLVNVFKTINEYEVYLRSIEIKGEGSGRFVYVEVLLNDLKRLKEYVNASQDHQVQSIGKEDNLFIYMVKVELRTQ